MATVSLRCLKPVNWGVPWCFFFPKKSYTTEPRCISGSVPDIAPDIYGECRCKPGVLSVDPGENPTRHGFITARPDHRRFRNGKATDEAGTVPVIPWLCTDASLFRFMRIKLLDHVDISHLVKTENCHPKKSGGFMVWWSFCAAKRSVPSMCTTRVGTDQTCEVLLKYLQQFDLWKPDYGYILLALATF
jgi:hypothetical protein